MKWLRDLILGKDKGVAPRHGAAQEEPDPIDWGRVENALAEASEVLISQFSKHHQKESFYGFGFDCNSSEGEVLLCFNTRAAQREAAEVTDGPYREIMLSMSESERLADAEWGFGSWKYQGFNAGSRTWEEVWQPVGSEIAGALSMLSMSRLHERAEAIRDQFLESAARALLRIKSAPAMSGVTRDPDFTVLCTDHDEGPTEGFDRMRRVSAGAS